MPSKPKYYWDACARIALIQREEGRYELCQHIYELAQRQEVEIWTSAFTLAEVYKRKCDDAPVGLAVDQDRQFEDFILQDFVIVAQVDMDVGTAARRLLRAHPTIKKPQDAIHVATAILNNVDELHTFDRDDLLRLSEVIDRLDGEKLKICAPPPPPPVLAPAPLLDFIGTDEKANAQSQEPREAGSAR